MRVNYLDTENYNQIVKYKIYVSFIGFIHVTIRHIR